ncbi:Zn-ribbon domain-containing OB-fold protein [Haloarchaeobius sp. DFWS5]|uniref:Zn-ribbon domain-containing OB-fold protein n=1 Tax=Haloarchaeobius sp. DFWS5 TaxID=3446114 RepID=UPI003EBB9D21
MSVVSEAGYDAFLDAIEAGAGFYLECEAGHGAVPPTQRCPDCGETDLQQRPLPSSGVLEDVTTIHVAPSGFDVETPYTVGIARFEAVTLTGVVRGSAADEAETSVRVVPHVERTESGDDRLLVFRPEH